MVRWVDRDSFFKIKINSFYCFGLSRNTGDYHVEGLLVHLLLFQRQGLDHSFCCLSVQVQQYSVDSRYPLTHGLPANFGSEDDRT